jgi:flagellar biosynthetic protein FliO
MDEALTVLTGAANTANDASLSPFQANTMQLLLYIFLFVAFFYVLYLVYKYFLPGGKRGLSFGKSRNMRVMDITPVGPGSTIQLVKVSEEYFLVGVTRTQITFMAKLDPSSVEAAYEAADNSAEAKPRFKEVFSNMIKKPKE